MAVLDSSIANVALPTIARDVRASPSESIWVVNAYQLAIVVSLLPLASLGDIVGYRLINRLGVVVFGIASLLCARADGLTALALARVLQGFGAAGIMSVNAALLRFIYPRKMLGTAMAINATTVAISAALGPTVASAILSVAPWQYLFYVNLPFALAAALIGMRSLPHSPLSGQSFDGVSAVLNALAFGLLITGLDGLGHGERWELAAVQMAAAALAGFMLVRRQLSKPAPLLPVDLMRIPIFALSIGASVCAFSAQIMALVAMPFMLQTMLGRSQIETGLLMTPWPLTVAIVAPLSGWLVARVAAGLLGGIGLAVMAAGLVSLAMLPDGASSVGIGWRMALTGAGFGLFQTPNNRAMIGAAPPTRSGGASGMLSMARLLGQTSGAALVSVLFVLYPLNGPSVALYAGACFAVLAGIVSTFRLRGPLAHAPVG